jgi:hypothetical protein
MLDDSSLEHATIAPAPVALDGRRSPG